MDAFQVAWRISFNLLRAPEGHSARSICPSIEPKCVHRKRDAATRTLIDRVAEFDGYYAGHCGHPRRHLCATIDIRHRVWFFGQERQFDGSQQWSGPRFRTSSLFRRCRLRQAC